MIGRIEIDFTLKDGETLHDLLHLIGDAVVPLLDPHDENDNCTRWVSVEAFEMEDVTAELGFTAEDEAEMGSLLEFESEEDLFRSKAEFN